MCVYGGGAYVVRGPVQLVGIWIEGALLVITPVLVRPRACGIYTHTHTHIYIYMYIYIHIDTHTDIYINTYIYIYTDIQSSFPIRNSTCLGT